MVLVPGGNAPRGSATVALTARRWQAWASASRVARR
jgi:hypothetical protein